MTHDPVCGMQVDERRAAGTAEYHGQVFYFCSDDCRSEFETAPDAWLPAFEPTWSAAAVASEPAKV